MSHAPVPAGLQLSGFLLSGLRRVCPREVLLDRMVFLCLVFGGTVTFFCTAAAPFHIPVTGPGGSSCPASPPAVVFCCTLSNSPPDGGGVVARCGSSCLFTEEGYCAVWTCCSLFLHSPIAAHLGCFQDSAVMDKAVKTVCRFCVHGSFQFIWVNATEHDCWKIW